jgi:hypothetical protein
MYYIEHDGKTVTEFDSCLEYEKATKDDPTSDSRLFAVHPDDNKHIYKDRHTGRYVMVHNLDPASPDTCF